MKKTAKKVKPGKQASAQGAGPQAGPPPAPPPPVDPSPPKAKKEKGQEIDIGSELELLKSSINKHYKSKVILSGNEIVNVYVLRRPTGIVGLDIWLAGGIPAGSLSQIIGSEGVGKDYVTNLILANLQQTYGTDTAVGLAMTEFTYDKKFAKKCGVRIALSSEEIRDWQAALGRPFTPEEMAWATDQVGTFHHVAGMPAEELLEISAQWVESNLYQVVVINSFGALLTMAEAETEGGIADKHRGGAAMPVTQFMHRLHAALCRRDKWGRPNLTTVIGINQYRDNVGGGVYANPLKIAGGHALKHGKVIDILLSPGAKIREANGNQNIVVGKEIHWEIIKGKAGCHDGPKGSYKFHFGEHGHPFGADFYEDLLVAGVSTGVLNQSGSWFSYQNQSLGQGKSGIAQTLYTNPALYHEIRKNIFDRSGVQFITKEIG